MVDRTDESYFNVNVIRHMLIWLVRAYRFTLSPALTVLFGPVQGCRFTPTCSQYALEALERHGAIQGSVLAAKRVCRCHPWSKCDHNDPVPPAGTRPVIGDTPAHTF